MREHGRPGNTGHGHVKQRSVVATDNLVVVLKRFEVYH